MHTYEVVPATEEHCREMLPNMRQEDIDEIYAAAGIGPEEALMTTFRTSTSSWAGLVDGAVFCVFGVCPGNLLAREGVPWLLGTPAIRKHAKVFLSRDMAYVRAMLEVYNLLENYVDVRNAVSIGWLKRLGFKFDEPVPYGKFGHLFMRFEMRG